MRPLELRSTHFKATSPEPEKYPDLPFHSDLNEKHMTSMWLPTDEEIEDIVKGGVIVIRIAGNQPVPMAVIAGMLSETEQEDIDAIRDQEWKEKRDSKADKS